MRKHDKCHTEPVYRQKNLALQRGSLEEVSVYYRRPRTARGRRVLTGCWRKRCIRL